MIRPRALKEETKKDLKHWGIELVVVVIGVLLALWAQEWVNEQAQKRDDALSLEAVGAELAENMVHVSVWQAYGECQREQITYVRDLLLSEGEDWPGTNRDVISLRVRNDSVMPDMFTIWSGRPEFEAWNAARANGALDRLAPQPRERLAEAYRLFEAIHESMEEIDEARGRIGGLALPQKLARTDRLDALNQLKIIDGGRRYIGRDWDSFDFGPSSEERELMRRGIEASEGSLRRVAGPLRPCFKGVQLPAALRD